MGKKKSSTSSKKRNGGGGGGKRKANNNRGDPFGTSTTETDAQENDTNNRPLQSIYQVYKAATSRFKEQLSSLLPSKLFNLDYVKSFLDAADYIQDNNIPIEDSMLRNLRLAISVRKKYSGGNDDEGHAYFLLVLNYCLQVLRQCPRVTTAMDDYGKKNSAERDQLRVPDDEEDIDMFCNRFDALSMLQDEEEEEDDDEEDGDESSQPNRPPEPSSPKQYSYYDLMHFPSKTKCLFLFDTMAYHAHTYTIALRNLKETMRLEANGEYPSTNVPAEIMCIGMYANSMIRNIQEVEQELYMECPELNESPYRVLVCCFMSPLVNIVSDSIRRLSPLAHKWKDEYALGMFGDVVEAVFRFKFLGKHQLDRIADRFVQRWQMPNKDKTRWVVHIVMRMTLMNTGFKFDEEYLKGFKPCEHTDPYLEASSDWLRANHGEEDDNPDPLWTSINGERSILNTMRIMELVVSSFGSDVDSEHYIKPMTCVVNGNRWNGENNPASTMKGDLDYTLYTILLNLMQCKWRFDGRAVPMEKHLLPLVSLMREWSVFKTAKPSLAITFATHAMMMSIFELQGDGDIFRIRDIASGSFDRFMTQAGEHLTLGVPCHSKRESCLKFIVDIKRVIEESEKTIFDRTDVPFVSQESFELLIWNPMSAGMFLAYTNVYLSLEGGFIAMTTSEDLSAVLHVYNALKYHELVDDYLPLLGDIDVFFDKTKCVWNGWEKPQQGKFVYRHHLSMGATNEMSKYSQDKARFCYEGGEKPIKPTVTLSTVERERKKSKRISTKIEAAEISSCFRRYCLHDFNVRSEDDEEFKLRKIDTTLAYPIPWQVHEANLRLTFGSLMSESESRLLKYNMISVGTVLTEFLMSLKPDDNENMAKFEAIVKESGFAHANHEGDVQSLVNLSVADEILAGLDYGDPGQFAYLGEAFEEFFYNLDMNRVCINNTT